MILLAVILIHSTTPTTGQYTCSDVRAVVATIGEQAAIKMARESGATEERIAEARRCLRRRRQ